MRKIQSISKESKRRDKSEVLPQGTDSSTIKRFRELEAPITLRILRIFASAAQNVPSKQCTFETDMEKK